MLQAEVVAAWALMTVCLSAVEPLPIAAFDKARDAALQNGKLVLLYFADSDQATRASYHKLTWSDPDVQQWLKENAVAFQVNDVEQAMLRARFNIRSTPTIIVASADSKTRARIVGFRDPATLLRELRTELRASDPLALARARHERRSHDAAARLTFAKLLEESGKIDEAVKEYRDCFEDAVPGSPAGSGFGGVRLVVVEELGRLAETHAVSRTALKRLRDGARDRLLSGRPERTDPAVLAAVNTRLGDFENTVETYRALHASFPRSLSTRMLREAVVDSALELRRYDTVTSLMDVVQQVRIAYEQHRKDRRRRAPGGMNPRSFREFERDAFLKRTVKYYEVLIGMGRLDDAAAVASMLESGRAGRQTYRVLSAAALRGGNPQPVNIDHAYKVLALTGKLEAADLEILVKLLLHLDRREEAARAVEQFVPRLADPSAGLGVAALLEHTPGS